MPKFVFAYHGGKRPETPEEGARVMALWTQWFQEMGDNVVDGGNPVGMSQTVTSDGVADGGGANPISGYTLVSASDMQGATDMAKGCPILLDGGSVEVAEAMEM